MVMKKCKICCEEFDVRGNAKFCSDECRKINKKNKNKEYYLNNRNERLEYQKEYNENHRDERREYNKQRYIDNRDNILTQQKEWRENNPEYKKEYYRNNQEKERQRNKEYYENNRDEILKKNKEHYWNNYEYYQEYRENHRDELNEYSKERYKNNSEYFKEYYENNRDEILKKTYIRQQNIISELCEQYDGDLEQILENVPNQWQVREAIMLVKYGISYAEAMYQKIKVNPVCEVTGQKDNLVIHHLDSFNTHPEKGADLDNLVRITKEIHDEFHSIYGYGNNTREQWFEFLEKNRNIYI